MADGRTYTTKIDQFFGADFSSPLLSVENYRAVDMANFIMKDNVNQTREGWKQQIKMPKVDVDNETHLYKYNEINGMYSFVADDNKKHIIVHYGTKLYEVELDKELYSYKYISDEIHTIKSFKSSGAVSNKRLYLFCGDFLVVYYNKENKQIEVKRVKDDSETTIPTTTIGITEENSILANRVAQDDVNIMTKWRINKLLSHTLSQEVYDKDYVVNIDNPVKFILDGKTRLNINDLSGNFAKPTLTIENFNKENGFETIEVTGTNTTLDTIYDNQLSLKLFPCYKFTHNNEIIGILTNYEIVSILKNKGDEGYVEGVDSYKYSAKSTDVARLYLYKDYIPPLKGKDNITLKYDGTFESASMITDCKTCIAYGYGSNRDTLFVGGNDKYPSMVFHTANNAKDEYKNIEERTLGDFTYWSDLDYISLGSSVNKVAGFSILGDGTLAVLKTQSINEPTIHFIGGDYRQATTYDGKVIDDSQEIVYVSKVGNVGETVFENDKTLNNLNGDTIFLSSHGVFGLSQSSNLNSSQRYTYSRSRLVNKRLLTENLENAVSIVFDNKYWLAFADTGHCYVFDSRYRTQLVDDLSSDFQYECWFLTNIHANGFFVDNDKLYFYTKNGDICEMNNGKYFDENKVRIESGDMTVDNEENDLYLSEYILNQVDENSVFVVNEEDNIYKYIPIGNYDELGFTYNTLTIAKKDTGNFSSNILFEGDIVLVEINDQFVNGVVSVSEYDSDTYTITFENELPESIYQVNAILKKLNNGEEYKLCVEEDNYYFVDPITNEIMLLYQPTSAPITYSHFRNDVNYEAFYITKLFDFGTNVNVKTINSLTLTSDYSLKSSCQFGYRTSYDIDYSYRFNYGNVIGIDYSNYDYTDLTYDPNKNFAQSFTYPSRIRNFNFIQFAFKKNEQNNCALSSLSIVYQIGTRKRGLY